MTGDLVCIVNFLNPSVKLEKLLQFLLKEVSYIEPTHLAHPREKNPGTHPKNSGFPDKNIFL